MVAGTSSGQEWLRDPKPTGQGEFQELSFLGRLIEKLFDYGGKPFDMAECRDIRAGDAAILKIVLQKPQGLLGWVLLACRRATYIAFKKKV